MKIVLVGDTQVGKTCLIRRLSQGVYSDNNPVTIGAAFQNHMIQTKKGSVSLQIWDTAGQEKVRALAPMYYRSANVAVLCFDLTNKRTFEALEQWSMEITEKAPTMLKIVLVGTKKDLTNDRQVSFESGKNFAESHGFLFYMETSAKMGDGIIQLFTQIAEMGEVEVGPIIATQPIEITKGERKEKKGCC